MVATSIDVRRTIAASVLIRIAEPEESLEIAAMQRQSLSRLSRGFYSEQQIQTMLRYMTLLDEHLLDDGTYYVAVKEGVIAACGGWSDRTPEYERSGVLPAHATDLPKVRAMYVHPSFAGCGLGRALLNFIEAAIVRSGRVQACLDATLPGVRLYQRCGYQFVANTEFVFPNAVRAPIVRMHKHLCAWAPA